MHRPWQSIDILFYKLLTIVLREREAMKDKRLHYGIICINGNGR